MKRGLALLLLVLAWPAIGHAQAISPGKLSNAHAQLEGSRNCTRCHELRRPGAAAERCLACHEPLRARIQQRQGLHGRMTSRACGECHKEHFGREFQLVRQEARDFDHEDTGYTLEGAHAGAECTACHRADRVTAADVRAAAGKSLELAHTSLGLPTSCRACHAGEDAHAGQFKDRDCDACHSPAEWERAARFDHGVARYQLTGRHQQVECSSCHPPLHSAGERAVKYTGLAFTSCRSCHEDAHRGAMGTECARCHTTSGWQRVAASEVAARFDHGSTRFPLRGAHAGLRCESCHGRNPPRGIRLRFSGDDVARTYPRPAASACTSCHLDAHAGAFTDSPGGTECTSCHTESGWTPTLFDETRHGATRFPLTGAHTAVPCGSCHVRGQSGHADFGVRDASCARCHAHQDPHGSAFVGKQCDECHGTASFRIAEWDHTRAPGTACTLCHATDDPHGAQFAGRSCEQCHDTASFRIPGFDHQRTRFPLEGKHATVACAACHVPVGEPGAERAVVRYRPLPVRCEDCHGGTP